MPKTKEYLIFCANDQKVTSWNHLPDNNGEILFQCTNCGRFLKFPMGTSRGKLVKLFVEQEKANTGDVVIETMPAAPLVYSQVEPPEIRKWWERVWDAVKTN